MRRRVSIILLAVATTLTTGLAWAQHSPSQQQGQMPSVQASPAASPGPFGTSVYGAFREMIQKRDYTPKVELGKPISHGATEAVGAASGLRAEITIIDGKPLVTYGDPCMRCPTLNVETATLLVTSKVTAWSDPIPLPDDLAGHALDRFIIETARQAGLDMSQPLPIRIRGTLINVAMHVIKSANPKFGGHGSGQPMALQEVFKAVSIDGEVVGFYAPEALRGIVTHPGDPFHYHWVDSARVKTAHLDAFGIAKGSALMLPVR
jgi:hypothetical protein